MCKPDLKKHDGFTLIEMAMMILVLSVVLIPMFNFIAQQRAQQERIENEEINERLLFALSAFLKNNGRYPCPANAALSYGDAGFAREPAGGCASMPGTVVQGDLPTYDMGIPYRLMYNISDHKYRYAVTKSQTTTAGYDGSGSITVEYIDSGGGTTNINNVPFIIVNPGEDGKGGIVVACGSSARDSENCDNDSVFRDAPYSRQAFSSDTNHFDDLVFYDLAREESTFWTVRQGAGSASMDIVNRNAGNIGVGDYTTGTTQPNEKFEVKGGNIKVDGGDVKAEGTLAAPEFYYE